MTRWVLDRIKFISSERLRMSGEDTVLALDTMYVVNESGTV